MYLANTFFLSRCVVSPGEEKEVCGWNSKPSWRTTANYRLLLCSLPAVCWLLTAAADAAAAAAATSAAGPTLLLPGLLAGLFLHLYAAAERPSPLHPVSTLPASSCRISALHATCRRWSVGDLRRWRSEWKVTARPWASLPVCCI